MVKSVKYVVDESGQKTSVLVPIEVWEEFQDNYSKLQNKLKVFKGIKEGFEEIKKAKKTGRNLQTLQDFLACE
jgi:hypothetical protein